MHTWHDRDEVLKTEKISGVYIKYHYGRELQFEAQQIINKTEGYISNKVSVIIPSRLQEKPTGGLWLMDALRSIEGQQVIEGVEIEVVVGLDKGAIPPDIPGVKFAFGGQSQAEALNAAVDMAAGDTIAFLEDDDRWNPQKLHYGLTLLKAYDFVSSNQLEFMFDEQSIEKAVRVNDFPTPSGWIMKRELFDKVGKFDETFKYHMDTEWLGRLNKTGALRCHIVENFINLKDSKLNVHRMHLLQIVKQAPWGSTIWNTDKHEPMVYRCIHPASGMSQISQEGPAKDTSLTENKRLVEMYGFHPW